MHAWRRRNDNNDDDDEEIIPPINYTMLKKSVFVRQLFAARFIHTTALSHALALTNRPDLQISFFINL